MSFVIIQGNRRYPQSFASQEEAEAQARLRVASSSDEPVRIEQDGIVVWDSEKS